MTETIICTVITAISAVVVAGIGVITNRDRKRDEARRAHSEELEKIRTRESMLSLKMADATLQLSVVTSNALTGGKNNGNVEIAREAAERAAEDYKNFMREILTEEISKY